MELPHFEPENMHKKGVCIVIGKNTSDKTRLINNIASYANQPIHIITDISRDKFSKNKTSSTIDKIINDQRERGGDRERLTIIIDSELNEDWFIRSEQARDLFCNGCCYNIWLLITVSSLDFFPPLCSGNTDYMFILPNNDNPNRIYKRYADMLPTVDVFNKTLDRYGCLVVDNTLESDDKILWYNLI